MRKVALLLALLIAASSPTASFAKKAKRAAPPPAAPAQTFESLNANGIKVVQAILMAPVTILTSMTAKK